MFNWFSNSNNKTDMSFASHNLSDHKEIKVSWLNSLGPIYLDDGRIHSNLNEK